MRIIPSRFAFDFKRIWRLSHQAPKAIHKADLTVWRPGLDQLSQMSADELPEFVRNSPVAMNYIQLLGGLEWEKFPRREKQRTWPGPSPQDIRPFVASFLVKLDQEYTSMSKLRQYLVDHPALTWSLGFPLVPSADYAWGFDVDASLPPSNRFCRVLCDLPNAWLQFLLDITVQRCRAALPITVPFGQTISIDTKHILAWVKENNPKVYIKEGRFDKTQQPPGDRDCRLGCKRKSNQHKGSDASTTPAHHAQPASQVPFGDYYWGYASGIAVTKVPDWGEFVIAELTQTFEKGDTTYFFPLMDMVEKRLGFKPPYGTMDAAFDAFYVYEYFHQAGGFAAVPLTQKGKTPKRSFSPDGLPLCDAGLPMPLKFAYNDNTSAIIPHQKGHHVCPLLFPEPSADACPIQHPKWAKGGCTTRLASSIGARLRCQIDRKSDKYKKLYQQRTATERINSQALALGIERPKLRNQRSITNQNTLIYILINLRSFKRIMDKTRSSPSA